MKTYVNKLLALWRFELNITLDNKASFIYTLGIPVVFAIINRAAIINGPQARLAGYWAYIIVVGVLNGVIAGMVTMRESNFLKMFSYIAGSRRLVYWANVLAQLVVIESELLVFNIAILVISGSVSIFALLVSLVGGLVLIPTIASVLMLVLLFRMRAATLNVVLNSFMLVGLFLAYVRVAGPLNWLLTIINPFSYAQTALSFLLGSTSTGSLVLVGFVIYLGIGLVATNKIQLSGVTSRYWEAVMEITNLTFKQPRATTNLFDQLSMHFSEHQVNVLIGPNGVGKSTLLDLIADVDGKRPAQAFSNFPPAKQIAYQLQGVPFIGEATVKATIELVLKIGGQSQSVTPPEYIQAIYNRRFAELSGGQRRLAIIYGISLLNRELYLFDEPESGLDPEMSAKVMMLISEMAHHGKRVILTTHEFANITDEHHIFALNSGKISFEGHMDAFTGKPREVFEQMLGGRVN